jgi:lipoprotein NlpI
MMRRLSRKYSWVWLAACGWLGTCSPAVLPAQQPDLARSIQQAVLQADWPTAEALAKQLIEREPNRSIGYLLRGRLLTQQRKYEAALPDYDSTLRLDPSAELYNERGSVRFQAGRITAALEDFDKAIGDRPELDAGHWQRGICYYYLERWEEGRKQFERYQRVDDNDVENVVWRAMCMARDPIIGWQGAAKDLWPVRHDRRVPLMVVHQLFADQATPQAVLDAVTAGEPEEQELLSRQFYANLYLGLYYDCRKQPDLALPYLEAAAGKYLLPGYMGEVAVIHAARLRAAKMR